MNWNSIQQSKVPTTNKKPDMFSKYKLMGGSIAIKRPRNQPYKMLPVSSDPKKYIQKNGNICRLGTGTSIHSHRNKVCMCIFSFSRHCSYLYVLKMVMAKKGTLVHRLKESVCNTDLIPHTPFAFGRKSSLSVGGFISTISFCVGNRGAGGMEKKICCWPSLAGLSLLTCPTVTKNTFPLKPHQTHASHSILA